MRTLRHLMGARSGQGTPARTRIQTSVSSKWSGQTLIVTEGVDWKPNIVRELDVCFESVLMLRLIG